MEVGLRILMLSIGRVLSLMRMQPISSLDKELGDEDADDIEHEGARAD